MCRWQYVERPATLPAHPRIAHTDHRPFNADRTALRNGRGRHSGSASSRARMMGTLRAGPTASGHRLTGVPDPSFTFPDHTVEGCTAACVPYTWSAPNVLPVTRMFTGTR